MVAASSSVQSPLATWVSKDLKDAYLKGDWSKIQDADAKMKSEFEPLADSFEKNGAQALNVFKDAHGNESRGMHTKDAMALFSMKEDPAAREKAVAANPTGNHADVVYNPTVFVGTYTKGGGQAFVSKQWWTEAVPKLTAIALSGAVGAMSLRFILNSLTGRAAANLAMAELIFAEDRARQILDAANRAENQAAITAAEAEVRTAVAARNAALAEDTLIGGYTGEFLNILARFPKASAFVGSALAAVAIYFVVEGINVLANKDFFIEVRIRNFDAHAWTVDKYYHDNGIIAGHEEFKALTIPKQSGAGSSDSGDWPIENPPTAQMAEVSSVTYRFQNSFTFLDGIGIALRVVQDDEKSKGFCLGYEIHATKDNQLTLQGEAQEDIKGFYGNAQNWPSDRPTAVKTTVHRSAGDIEITASTNALGGLSEPRIYMYGVNIGS